MLGRCAGLLMGGEVLGRLAGPWVPCLGDLDGPVMDGRLDFVGDVGGPLMERRLAEFGDLGGPATGGCTAKAPSTTTFGCTADPPRYLIPVDLERESLRAARTLDAPLKEADVVGIFLEVFKLSKGGLICNVSF